MTRLITVIHKVRDSGLKLSVSKCKFGVQEVEYLGCIVKHGMLCLSEQRVHQIRSIEPPKTVQDLRRALGAFAYVQRWVPRLAEVAQPLYKAITDKKYERLKWDTEKDEAFTKIKDLIANAVSLQIPDFARKFVLVTDCSDMAAGAMLAQKDSVDNNCLRPIAFFHYTLTKAEQGYDTTEKELLAVV